VRYIRFHPQIIQALHHGPTRLFGESGAKHHGVSAVDFLLAALDTARNIDDLNVPGFRLHELKGEDRGRWSVWVNGNWRVTFEYRDGQAYIVDYEDYH